MKKRKILFKDIKNDKAQLIITDAPVPAIQVWCGKYNNGEYVELFGNLKALYYVKELFDSTYDEDKDDIEIIGYDEEYDYDIYHDEIYRENRLIKEYSNDKVFEILDFLFKTGGSYTKRTNVTNMTVKDLWNSLGNVPIDDRDCIEEDWYSFKKGTRRFDIWHWFEDMFHLSVAIDLMHLDEKHKND